MDTQRLTTLFNVTALVAMMLSMGLQVEFAEILAAVRPARRIGPGLLGVLLARIAPEGNLHVDYPAIVRTLLITRLLPLGLGLVIHRASPRLTRAIARPVGLLANGLLLALVGLIVATQHETLEAIRLRGWFGMGLLLPASLGIGGCCGAPDVAIRKALAMTTATRNVAVGLVIATSSFAGTPVVTAVVAYGLVSIVGGLGCALLFGRFVAVEPGRVFVGP